MDNKVKDYIIKHPDFSTGEFIIEMKHENSNMARATAYKRLKELLDSEEIVRIGRGSYARVTKRHYDYCLSTTAKSISLLIKNTYPLAKFQIWELNQMNEFINHHIEQNTIVLDVENKFEDPIFRLLFEKYTHVLYKPSYKEYCKYSGQETIVVKNLISEAPTTRDALCLAPLEKILVDLFCKGISGSIVPQSECKVILESCFENYIINISMMFRYARRRGQENKIKEFIRDNTSIKLEGE